MFWSKGRRHREEEGRRGGGEKGKVFSTAAPENLHDPHFREIGHRVNELGNLFGPTTVWTVGNRLCIKTGMTTTFDELQLRNSGTSRQFTLSGPRQCRNDHNLVQELHLWSLHVRNAQVTNLVQELHASPA